MENITKLNLDALYTLRNDLKLELIHYIITNDFDIHEMSRMIYTLDMIQDRIDKIEGGKN